MEPKETFYSLLEIEINSMNPKKRDTFVIDSVKYKDILATLTLKKGVRCEKGPHFKQWVMRNFKVVTIGAVDYVYSIDTNVQVAKKEDIFDILSL